MSLKLITKNACYSNTQTITMAYFFIKPFFSIYENALRNNVGGLLLYYLRRGILVVGRRLSGTGLHTHLRGACRTAVWASGASGASAAVPGTRCTLVYPVYPSLPRTSGRTGGRADGQSLPPRHRHHHHHRQSIVAAERASVGRCDSKHLSQQR